MLRKPLTPIDDDTEEAPWMVMGTPQWTAATVLYSALHGELQSRQPAPFVAAMLPIRYYPIPGGEVEQLAPDIMVAWVPSHHRNSYDVEREGVAPAFVLEVVSPASQTRDLLVKPERYERMGVEEYALFAPPTPDGALLLEPPLQGYRREAGSGEFVRWEADGEGRLYSAVLELWLVAREGELRVQRPDGSWVLTPAEERQARRAAEVAGQREAQARRAAEAEVARLRAELERRGQ
jgi:hypothetical protein